MAQYCITKFKALGPRPQPTIIHRNLADIFSEDPEIAAKHPAASNPRALLCAGSNLEDEFELKKLQVFVRIRPSNTEGAPTLLSTGSVCVHAASRHALAIAPPETSQAYKAGDRGQTYAFTRVFEASTSQEEYYQSSARPLIVDMLRNPQHNSVIMAYGITAAGKTYTIEGTKSQPGVMPRALHDVFAGIESHVEPLVVKISHCEVYNEQIYDLMEDIPHGAANRPSLKLKEDSINGRLVVAGLKEVCVSSVEEALALLRKGSRHRQRADTGLNYASSRSHSIFTVALSHPPLEAEDGEEEEQQLGRIAFVDLAGSERAQRTGNVGARLRESVAINSSLMTLGRCLEALKWNQSHKDGHLRVVPYRESKVTHLFRDALHGWGRVVLSVNVSPTAADYDETAHVLKYAALATQIGTLQAAEAPRRTIKAFTPGLMKRAKRKAALPPEARGGGGPKKAKPTPGKVKVEHHERLEAVRKPSVVLGEEMHVGELPVETAVADLGEMEKGENPGSHQHGEPSMNNNSEGEDYFGSDLETPGAPEKEEEDDETSLQARMQVLLDQLQAAEEKCVLVESEVRAEVADEMAALLKDMERSYRDRLAAQKESVGTATSIKQAKADIEAELHELQALYEDSLGTIQQYERQVARLEKEVENERDRTAELSSQLVAREERVRQLEATVEEHKEKSSGWGNELQDQLTQLEANRSMELEMMEAQLDRARRDAAAVQQQLDAAMGALAALGSPSATAIERLAALNNDGGRAAGGTPHDIALARARQATAAEDAALAPLLSTKSTDGGNKSSTGRNINSNKSRFAVEADDIVNFGSQLTQPDSCHAAPLEAMIVEKLEGMNQKDEDPGDRGRCKKKEEEMEAEKGKVRKSRHANTRATEMREAIDAVQVAPPSVDEEERKEEEEEEEEGMRSLPRVSLGDPLPGESSPEPRPRKKATPTVVIIENEEDVAPLMASVVDLTVDEGTDKPKKRKKLLNNNAGAKLRTALGEWNADEVSLRDAAAAAHRSAAPLRRSTRRTGRF